MRKPTSEYTFWGLHWSSVISRKWPAWLEEMEMVMSVSSITTTWLRALATTAEREIRNVAGPEINGGVALDELKNRKLAPRPVEQVQKERESVDASNAGVPLEGGWFLGALLMPMFFFPWLMVASNLERKGFARKARTLRRIVWFELGFIALMVVIAVVSAKTTRH